MSMRFGPLGLAEIQLSYFPRPDGRGYCLSALRAWIRRPLDGNVGCRKPKIENRKCSGIAAPSDLYRERVSGDVSACAIN